MFFSKAPSMTLGIAALAAPGRGPRDDLWMGSAAGEPIPWRVLSREGNGGRYRNAAGEEVSGPALLLVTSCLLGDHFQDGIKKDSDLRFYQEGTEPDTEDPALLWRQSAARAWCGDFFASCLSPLEQEAVLFTTPAPQGWRLTLRDRARETFSLGQPVREGQTLVLPYRNAFPADAPDPAGERVSVIVAAPDGTARDYRAIARPAAPDGVARLELSGLKRKKGDRLLVFSERQEEKQVTGYASPLIQVPEN